MQLADGPNSINMCLINSTEYDLLYLIDLDGSFRPNPSITPSVSTLVASDNRMHMTFVDATKCIDNTFGCYSYCQDTCFRSMRYYAKGSGQESYKVKVCSRNDHSRCSFFKGGRRDDTGPHEFTAHLPAGQLYDAVFVDANGQEIIPTTVSEVVEKTFCTSGDFEVTLYGKLLPTPPVSRPVAAPVQRPVGGPIAAPMRAPTPPNNAPVKAPMRAPVSAPMQIPVEGPVSAPANAPIRIQEQTPPVQAPVRKRKSIFQILFPWLFK
jgi:hypothetical protein